MRSAGQDQIETGARDLTLIGVAQALALMPGALATIVAFVVGYAAIALLLRFLTSHSTRVFVIYRVGLGAMVLALVAAGVTG